MGNRHAKPSGRHNTTRKHTSASVSSRYIRCLLETGEPRKFTHEAAFPGSAAEHAFLPRLWATRRVGFLLDDTLYEIVDESCRSAAGACAPVLTAAAVLRILCSHEGEGPGEGIMSNTFGRIFRVTTFGESHGPAIGAVIDGCPPGLALAEADIQPQLDRRRPGRSDLSSPRAEPDRVRILSGVSGGRTLGSPVALVIENRDARPADYRELRDVPRPSHADFTYREKYGVAAPSGGGRASARETAGRVAAGAVAEKLLAERFGVSVVAWVSAVEDVAWEAESPAAVRREDVDATPLRCPDAAAAERMARAIRSAAADGDSVGGIVTGVCRGVPAGWGEPVFGKLHAVLGAAMLSIPAVKGFEIGSGFAGARMRGSAHNDRFVMKEGGLGTDTNRSGGVQGGISNGEPVVFRVAFKPVATIARPQDTAAYDGAPVTLRVSEGRHDPCVLPRAVPVVEAMAALALADAALLAAAGR